MHLLEMAKTAWNASLTDTKGIEPKNVSLASRYLEAAEENLGIFGKEGDDDGPMTEINTLQRLLAS
jgi:hypothetical protein